MARQTRQRILDASLTMFNAQGEPNVTTNHIADELEISPGNLYYHFRNKDDIIEHLFGRYEERIDAALSAPEGRLPGLEDIWLQLHLVFEAIWDYRFLYRDLVEILSRNRRLRLRFARILKRADEQAHAVMRGLSQAGVMRASSDELAATATNVAMALRQFEPAKVSIRVREGSAATWQPAPVALAGQFNGDGSATISATSRACCAPKANMSNPCAARSHRS